MHLIRIMGDRLDHSDETDLDFRIEVLRGEVRRRSSDRDEFCSEAEAALAAELAGLLAERYEQRLVAGDGPGGQADLRESAVTTARAADRSGRGSWWLGELLWRAGISYDQCWQHQQDPADRDDAIGFLSDALGETASGDPDWLAVAEALGLALYDRFGHPAPGSDPQRADLNRAIELLASVFPDGPAPDTTDDVFFGRFALASALMDRAETGRPDRVADLDAAIGQLESAAADSPDSGTERGLLFADLARAYWRRLDGDASCWPLVDRMVGCAREGWRLLPGDDEDRPYLGLYLAAGIHEQLMRPNAPYDPPAMSEAIDVLTEIEVPLRADFGQHLIVAATLGHFLAARAQAEGGSTDLAAAQPWLMEAAASIPLEDQAWTEVAHSVGAGLGILAHLGMDVGHLDAAIEFLAATAERPESDPVRAALRRGALGGLLVQRSGFTSQPDDLDAGIAHLQESYGLAPVTDPYRWGAALNLGSALLTRSLDRGQAEDADAARYYLELAGRMTGTERAALSSLMPDTELIMAANQAMLALVAGQRGDADALDDAVRLLRVVLAELPAGHPYTGRIRSDLGLALAFRAGSARGGPADLAEAAEHVSEGIAAMGGSHLMRPFSLLRVAAALAAAAAARGDQHALRQVVAGLTALAGDLDPRFGHRYRLFALLGIVTMVLGQRSGQRRDREVAVSWLEQARDDLGDRPFHPEFANTMINLARAYQVVGDSGATVRAGFAALRARSHDLLLQSGTGRSLSYARLAAGEAAEVAAWCLDGRRAADAVAALELGHGLILHAATAAAEVPDMLIAAGQPGLATQWRMMTSNPDAALWDEVWPTSTGLPVLPDTLRAPDELRRDVLLALGGTPAEQRLVAPPAATDLAAALTEVGADALVYLLESARGQPGRAIIVPGAHVAADGPWPLPLPGLDERTGQLIDEYLAASAAVEAGSADGPARERWRAALLSLCDWAGPAVIEPVRAATVGWDLRRPPRLVMIPAGRLSVVPWHAARSRPAGAGPIRYALQDMLVSGASSGRQLRDVALRTQLPLTGSPVIVGDPSGTLPGALREAQAIASHCYPGARYLGPLGGAGRGDGTGTPGEVLEHLPTTQRTGASMLHLGCHGVVSAQPGQSHLILAGDAELQVDAVLRQARGRPPEAPGGLVTLAACSSDLSAGEYNEALTPATAFLAAGAVTVVAARWALPDRPTTLLMFMFHYLMTCHAHAPRDALRLAQLWMADPGRAVPPEMPAELAKLARRPGLEDVTVWGAFVHQGR
jgi:hypothetical protein